MTNPNDLREALEDALLDAGTAPTPQLLDRLETAAEQRAFELAGEQIGTLIARLDIRQRVVWQRLMGVGPTLDECAAKLGVSKPAVHQAEKRLRRRLEKNRLPAPLR
jgi:DNA-directed RNA polymerase specialized sigma24 family protein